MLTCWVPFASDAPPPDTVISIVATSSFSYKVSSIGVKVAVPVVCPAEIVMSDIVL